MIQMELYIFRHGKTVWNAAGKIQGSTDIELTDEGRQMAVETAENIKDIHFDAIYSSPLKRAYETACLLKGSRPLEVIKDDRLRELNFGVLEGTNFMNIREGGSDSRYSVFFTRPDLYERPENGESLEELCARGKDFLEMLKSKHDDTARVMIVAHGAMNKALLKNIRGLEMKNLWYGRLQQNCAATIVRLNGDESFELIDESRIFYQV